MEATSMFQYTGAALLGLLAGLLAAIPGVHVSVLLVTLLPLLGIGGEAGAIAITTAVGSGLMASTLAKTFHPATEQTIQSATPEQLMAYQGRGLHAVRIQQHAMWVGILTVIALAIPLLALKFAANANIQQTLSNLTSVLTPVAITLFYVAVIMQAKNKPTTLAVLVLASLLGFYTMNHPAFTGNLMVLTPILGGLFAIPTLLMVALHQGNIKPLPKQLAARPYVGSYLNTLGAVGGIATALVAGLGAGSAVSIAANKLRSDEYLGMNTAAEAANNAFAIILFIVAGLSRSGSAVAIKQELYAPSAAATGLLVVALMLGLSAASRITEKAGPTYALIVSRIPQRGTAAVIGALTITVILTHTGVAGLAVAITATLLGLIAKLYYTPNQALLAVLAGPVLVYHLGLSGPLAQVLGIAH